MTTTPAFEALLRRRPELLRLVRRRVGNDADADDVLQSALVRAMRSVGNVRDEAALVSWFREVVRTTLTDHQRAQVRAAREVPPSDVWVEPPHEIGACACAVVLLVDLPASYAEILTRVDVQDEPVAVAAQALGLTRNNATVRLHRARMALRKRLEACCGCKSTRECQSCACAIGEV